MAKCCDFRASMLRETVEFQRATDTPDDAGGFTQVWGAQPTAPTRAAVKAMSGFERTRSDRVEAESKFKFTTRYFADILESDRILFRGKTYNIRFLNNVEFRDRWLVIDVSGGVAT